LFVIGKVKRKELPAARKPELNAKEFEATVWVTAPVFRQQTVARSGTVRVPFWNEKSTMSITVSPAWQLKAA
jgi:N-methylhydantoinase A/oxoprolinase/acetone carboxylase beta subunit